MNTIRRLFQCSGLLLLVFYTVLALLPLYLMVVSSLAQLGGTFSLDNLSLFPTNPRLDNLEKFNMRVNGQVPRWFFNSLLVSTLPVASNIFLGVGAGFAMAKLDFPGRRLLFWLIIATMTIPQFVVLIPLYEMVWNFRWVDSYIALTVPFMAGIGAIFLARQFMLTLPSALVESAVIDGCSEFGVFWHVILPLARPLLAVLAIMGFVGSWSEYFWAYLVTNSREMYTLQMGIMGTIGVDGNYAGELDYGEIMAISLVASLPIYLVFLLAQKHFLKGLTVGAVKG